MQAFSKTRYGRILCCYVNSTVTSWSQWELLTGTTTKDDENDLLETYAFNSFLEAVNGAKNFIFYSCGFEELPRVTTEKDIIGNKDFIDFRKMRSQDGYEFSVFFFKSDDDKYYFDIYLDSEPQDESHNESTIQKAFRNFKSLFFNSKRNSEPLPNNGISNAYVKDLRANYAS